jgi:hypothetical protein
MSHVDAAHTYQSKLDEVRNLLEAFNKSASTDINFDEFLKKLKAAGGVTEAALRECRWEDIMDFGVPKLLARQVAAIFRQSAEPKREKALKPHQVQELTIRELLERYDPAETDHLVNQRLLTISKGYPCIVFNDDGKANVDASVYLVQEIKDGYEPRKTYIVNGAPQELKRVNERADDYVDENPLFAGRALRGGSEQICDITNRRWDSCPKKYRQVLHIAVNVTKELEIRNASQAHDVLDKIVNKHEEAISVWLGERFPNAMIKWQKMDKLNELPSLKLVRSKLATNKSNDPFYTGHRIY